MPRIRKSESGQVYVLASAAIFIIMGLAAMVVDLGFLYATRRNMQTAADAAAVAGANALQNSQACASGTTSCLAATDVATLNGYSNGGPNGMAVTVSVPPGTPPPNPSNGTFVQVDVSEQVPTFFMKVVGFSTVSVGATAIAGFAPTPNCIVQLNKNAQNALVVSGSGNVQATGCNVVVDSTNTSGLVVSGSGILDAGSVGVAAPSESQASDASSPGGQGVSPAYVVNTPNVSDPYAAVAPPSPCSSSGGCGAATGSPPCNALTTAGNGFTANSSQTISPGMYCGGITVSGGTLTLTAGTYILNGGGLTVQGGATITDGTTNGTPGAGVTFYNTYPAGNSGKYKTLNITGGSTANLSAPASGATVGIPGILFFQDRSSGGNNPGNAQNHVSASTGTLNGALYFSTQQLIFEGSTTASVENITLVADTLTFSGSANVASPATGTIETTGVKTTKLYE